MYDLSRNYRMLTHQFIHLSYILHTFVINSILSFATVANLYIN